MLQQKSFLFEIKDSDGNGSTAEFEGYSAALGNKDLHNDVIEPGAFSKTIKERVASGAVKLLDSHRTFSADDVLGTVVEAKEEKMDNVKEGGPTHKLWTRFAVSSDDSAQKTLRKVKEGHLNSLSIGYRPIKVEFEKDEDSSEEDPRWAWIMGQGTRRIKELAWWETSIVLWPANPEANIIDASLKTLDHFSDYCKGRKEQIPQRYVEAAVKSLNNLIDLDVDYDQLQNVKSVIDNLQKRAEEMDSVEKDIFTQLINEYKDSQDRPSREHFFMWFTDQIKDRDAAEFEKEVAPEDNDQKDTETEVVEETTKDSDDSTQEDLVEKAVRAAMDHLKAQGFVVAAPPTEEHDEKEGSPDDGSEAVESTSEKDEAAESTSEEKSDDSELEKLRIALELADTDLNF
jgi:uncharacterized protein